MVNCDYYLNHNNSNQRCAICKKKLHCVCLWGITIAPFSLVYWLCKTIPYYRPMIIFGTIFCQRFQRHYRTECMHAGKSEHRRETLTSYKFQQYKTVFSRQFTNSRAIGTLHCCVCRLSSSFVTLFIVAKRCVLEQKLLLRAYRKSYMRNRLVPKWMTLTFV